MEENQKNVIIHNLETAELQIKQACIRSKRDRGDITLVAVSKTKPITAIIEAYNYGIRDFGENHIQELVKKSDELPKDIRWHMIGHLQKNKVHQAVKYASLIHSVDTFELADIINTEAVKQSKICDVLIEVNIANEKTKYGCSEQEALVLTERIAKLSNVKIKGLMTIAPYTKLSVSNRKYFQRMRQLFIDISSKNIDNENMKVLSMGMSCDFETAIEEGTTMIRLGTFIFGER